MSEQSELVNRTREAAKITLEKISSWEELNAATLEEGNQKFSQKTRELWRDFAVSGILQFDPKEKKQVLRPFTDLDGRSAIGILRLAGINTNNLTYIRPGEYLQGDVNLDTGDRFGVVYEEPTYTAFFDHHAQGTKEVTSTTAIVYETMVELGMFQKSKTMDRLAKFVTDIDNRRLPPEEFLRSGKTILGLQRELKFETLFAYFQDHESPTEELTPGELEKYHLKDQAEKQEKIVAEAMTDLERMEKEGKLVSTLYGQLVINVNNELRVGASAAYVKYDGIINIAPGKSFAVTLKDKNLDEMEIKKRLGDKFQGKFIRNKMWIYNDRPPLELSLDDIIQVLSSESVVELRKKPVQVIKLDSKNTVEKLKGLIPNQQIVACDFYIQGIESGEEEKEGYSKEGVLNIDHHALTDRMARLISSTNLAIDYVKRSGVISDLNHAVVINHTDCDSVLSSAIIRGILPPDERFSRAAIAADHTGEEDEIADLLQALQDEKNLEYSLTNLDLLISK